ncbi:MAG: hypothetical protein CMK32_09435 [Porticoccaceae bacterium]|nr:hypothetical protein [Porticoccaceae bacterium]
MSAPEAVQSPCIGLCRLDDRNLCQGCFRHRDEIASWRAMSEEERSRVVALARLRARGF